ncbi:hypothetical protein [Clostridium botulinum]|uniref:hypothetical protein n=1 Tax=Clostridium botulinum TaxID=1491 RepID=UPI000773F930|nr:hypothetical protein [Clostridium botulinum]NFL39290.1 hypothetical protein [Clostridium botulinum]NFL65832.1 hypothetical protein [Clostridium botulinum]
MIKEEVIIKPEGEEYKIISSGIGGTTLNIENIDKKEVINMGNKSISEAVEIVQHELNKIRGNNMITEATIEKILDKVVDDKTIRIEVGNGMKLLATTIQPGEFTFTVKVTEKSTEEYEIIQSKIIIEMLDHM